MTAPSRPASSAGDPPGPAAPAHGAARLGRPAWSLPQAPARLLRPVLLVNLVAQVAIVVTGGVVRLTGSGLGCPTWPQCVPGSYTPVVRQAQGWHKDVEFGNRLLTFVVGAAAVAVVVVVSAWVLRTGAPRRLLALAAIPVVGVVAQAVVGGITVLTDLAPAAVAAHFLVSMALVATSTVLLLALTRPDPPATGRAEVRWLAAAMAVVAAVVLALGTVVTGSGPHSGDAVHPSRFGVDPRSVSWLHADAVWLFVGLVLALVVVLRLVDGGPVARRRVRWLLAVTVLQGTVGYTQYFTGLPGALVATHMLGAGLLTIAVTAVVLAVRGTPWHAIVPPLADAHEIPAAAPATRST
ncbi:MAG TPA: COX15/CtaA family protein [Kineosporiaceae bacterium]|nr:COX15/CtaA family protein [Kineosporiaceae bacterium]